MEDDIKITLRVEDTSPSLSYFPFGDTLSTPNVTAGWNPFFNISGYITAPGETGNGTSYHVTAHNGASVSLRWTGTGIQLFGRVTGDAQYSIILDGSPDTSYNSREDTGLLASYLNLTNQNHNISLIMGMDGPEDLLYFEAALIVATSPTGMPPQSLNGGNISFFGNWSNETSDNVSLYKSVTQGDRARTVFQGGSFELYGTTSPTAGRYSVTLDNATTILSGKSSFTKDDSLLYFATGLDPGINHVMEVVNLDGDQLSLLSPSTPRPLPNPEPVGSLSQRSTNEPPSTIVAFVLAGVLLFFIMTGALWYFLVIRPRRQRIRRARLEHREKRRKQREAGEVLNIGQEAINDMEMASLDVSHQSTGGRSGFARWKREVEGGLGNLGIGIVFRHSDSTQGHGRGPSRFEAGVEPLSTKSSMFTISSKPSSKKSKGKGKGKKNSRARDPNDSQSSPSFTVELPTRPPSSADSQKDKDKDMEGHYSISSGLTSLSYMSTPVRVNPPSYTVLGIDRNNDSSIPRSDFKPDHSISPANNFNQSGSEGTLLGASSPGAVTEGAGRIYESFASNMLQSDTTIRPILNFADDRGSIQYSSDEAKSTLERSTTQVALRSLSPRTESIQPRTRSDATRREEKVRPPLPPVPLLSATTYPTHASSIQQRIMESPSQWEEEENSTSEPTTSEVQGVRNKFLSVRATSPFKVDFTRPLPPPRHKRASTRASASFVRFEDDNEEVKLGKGKEKAIEEQPPIENPQTRAKKPSTFRLSPPVGPRPSNNTIVRHGRAQSSSFLDFSSSSDTSNRTHSVATSTSQSDRDRTSAPPPLPIPPKSSWSNAFTQSTDLSRSGTLATNFSRITHATDFSSSDSTGVSVLPLSPASAPRSVFSGTFPYPVSLPPSPHHPEGHKRTPSPSTWRSSEHARNDSADRSLIHPSIASPTDSVPISVTELKFRHSHSTSYSHSDNNSNSSILPPHPPLPGRETDDSEAGTPGLSTPQYIVQRVLGHTPSASASSPGFMITGPSSRSDSPSTALPRNDKSRTKK